jgi:S-formylglutathione hydrolase
MSINEISSNKSFGGVHKRFTHKSTANNCTMTFAIYLPPQAEEQNVSVVYWLSGLTCTDENFMQKAGAMRVAAELGLAIVAPDTSPRGHDVPDAKNQYDLGQGAGFYVNATQQPWCKNYQMYDYIVSELPALIEANFPVTNRRAIFGHSMGGHGAITIGLKNPQRYTSISALSPISNPSACAWGEKLLGAYLGNDKKNWAQYDSCELLRKRDNSAIKIPLLADQGTGDEFYPDQLLTQNLIIAAQETAYPATIRLQDGYDHSYFFIASFIEEHLHFHSTYLQNNSESSCN